MTLCFAYFATESVSEPREGARAAEAATREPGNPRPGTTPRRNTWRSSEIELVREFNF